MRSTLTFLIAAVFASQVSAFSSAELKNLWDIPTQTVSYEIISSYQQNSVRIAEVYYQSRPYNGQPVKIFAYYCYPVNSGQKVPGILLSHGGGGTASLARSIAWARRGYAVLAIDLPGKGYQRSNSRSTGPDMDVPVLLRTAPDPGQNYLVHAVAAARNGITFLCQRPEVDADRIGMVGLSWGGVITLLTNGQDKRLKAAVNVFGAGYIPEGCTWQDRFDNMSEDEAANWYSLIDPKNFLKTQHAPILFITGTNDHCYYLPTFQKSYTEVTAPKSLYLVPNLKHQFFPETQQVVLRWLDDKLKHQSRFPAIELLAVHNKGKDKVIIPVEVTGTNIIKNVTLHYAQGEPSRWTRRQWQSLAGYYEDGTYYFGISADLLNPEIMFFVNAEDTSGAAVSTPIRSLFAVNLFSGKKTYALSSPIQKVSVHEPPLILLGLKTLPLFTNVYFSKINRIYQLVENKDVPSVN